MPSDDSASGSDVVALTVRVPRELRQQLRLFAVERDLSVQQCAVEAIQTWLRAQPNSHQGRP